MPRNDPTTTLRTGLPAQADYEIGYAKPPVATRFKPGQSGNPKGRPKGAKNRQHKWYEERLKEIVLEEAYREVRVRDGDRQVSVPVAQAVVRALAVNAAKGQHRAQRLFSELLAATESANRRHHDDWLETAITYKVDWERELARRAALGIEAPAPLPHPDDIEIDFRTGEVRIKGPMSKEEQAEFDMWRQKKAACIDEIAEWRHDLDAETDPELRRRIEGEIAQAEKVLNLVRRLIPD